ncbi:MAG: DUF1801 domain-containing protein [Gemmatimonadales bacterium]
MARSTAPTVAALLAQLPAERRAALTAVRRIIKRHLPAGYRETVTRDMITYEVPLRVYPTTYNGQALWYAALASQKGYATLHLMAVYGSAELQRRLQDGFRRAGKRLDMGKACIRFRHSSDLALDVIGELIASVPMPAFIATAEAVRRRRDR